MAVDAPPDVPDVALSPRAYRALIAALAMVGVGVIICSVLILRLGVLSATNHNLIGALHQRDIEFDQSQHERDSREDALRGVVAALQHQVLTLGGTPAPLPIVLRVNPSSGGSSSAPPPSPAPRPAPSPTRGRRPSPRSYPSPSPTSALPMPVCSVAPQACAVLSSPLLRTSGRTLPAVTAVRVRANLPLTWLPDGQETVVERSPLVDGLLASGMLSVVPGAAPAPPVKPSRAAGAPKAPRKRTRAPKAP